MYFIQKTELAYFEYIRVMHYFQYSFLMQYVCQENDLIIITATVHVNRTRKQFPRGIYDIEMRPLFPTRN